MNKGSFMKYHYIEMQEDDAVNRNLQTFVWMSLIKGIENLLGKTMKFFT